MVQALGFIDSPEQLLLILAIALLFFGPSKLPQLGSSLGKAIKAYKDGAREDDEPSAALSLAPAVLAAACPKCGVRASDGQATFCTRCGVPFAAITA